MADGSGSFNFPLPQRSRLRSGEIIVDLFAGGGGASEALKQALGRDPDLAYNHDEWAIGMHAANHPLTEHHREDIWHADPRRDVAGRRVGWFHASPDCTHFSQAKGGQPRNGKIRALTWVVLKWCGQLKRADQVNGTDTAPRIVSLENVWQILTWGPLISKRCKVTGRVLKMDGSVAAKGERVPVEQQQLVPDKRQAGRTWRQFIVAMRALGYEVEWRKLTASDYGAGTSRTRLFMIARRDGEQIQWPAATHGKAPGLEPLVTAADCIDWSIPCPSIFSRKKPLADATHRRIAKGIHRYVLGSAEPFIVPNNTNNAPKPASEPVPTITTCNGRNLLVCPSLIACANTSSSGVSAADAPLGTITAWPKGGSTAVVAPMLVQAGHGEGVGDTRRRSHGINDITRPLGTVVASGGGHSLAAATLVQTGYGERAGQQPRALDLQAPLGTLVSGCKHAAVTAFLEQANGGFYEGAGNDMRVPVPTICSTGSKQRLVTGHLAKLRGTSSAADAQDPLATISAGGEHHAVVECTLSPEHEAGALRVAAFLMRYHSTGGQHGEVDQPLTTITTKDRLALVTVTIQGMPYVIVDIGLRMLQPPELYRAQGFPPGYIINRTADGRRLTTTSSVRMVGNSVSPPPLCAVAQANLDPVEEPLAVAA